MTSTGARAIALCLLAAAACRSRDAGPRPSRPAVVATFTGTVDAATGAVTIRADAPEGSAPGLRLASLVEIPVEQDGTPGSGTPDTVELVTERAATVAGACGAVDGFEGDIRLRSFYPGAVLTNVHVELTSLTPTGREACNSAERYDALSDVFGLWDHGTVGRAGGAFDASLRTWRFRLPDQTAFVFHGHVVAELVTEDPNPPTTTASPGAGSYGGGTSVELQCTDAETGCAATYYTTDGSVPTTDSPVYAGPLRLTAGFTLRWFSIDYWGNVEAVQSADYEIDESLPWLVSGPGSATLEPGGIAFDAAGNGLAVWRTMGQKVLYSCYTAASGGWSGASVLHSGRRRPYTAPRVAASADRFAVAWIGEGIQAAVFDGCAPGPVTTLTTSGYQQNAIAVASNGAGFLVAWSGAATGSEAADFDGVSWTQPYFFTTTTAFNVIAAAGEGDGYRIIYSRSGTVSFVRRAGGVWSSPETLGSGWEVAVASEGGATCMAWHDSVVSARVDAAGAGTAATVISRSGPVSPTPRSVAVAMNGGRCQVVANSSSGTWGAVHDGVGWAAPAALGVAGAAWAVGVAPRGASDFTAVVLQGGDLWVNRTDSGAWGTAQLAESSGEPARSPLVAAGSTSVAHVLYAQADAGADQVSTIRWDGSAVSAPARLSDTVLHGRSSGVKMAAAANGDALALWTQQHRGRDNVFWALRQGSIWSAPQLLATEATAMAVASNGTDFMVAYRAGPTGTRTLVVRRFVAGAFLDPVELGTAYNGPAGVTLASDGEGYAIGYALSVSGRSEPLARIFGGAGWSAAKALSSSQTWIYEVSVAGRSGEYLFAWNDQPDATLSAMSWRATGTGVTWVWETEPRIIAADVQYRPVALAAGPGGFVAAYASSTGVDAAVMNAGVWSAPVALETDGTQTYAAASNGGGYLVATSPSHTPGPGLQVHVWNGSWLPARGAGYASGVHVAAASDGVGYELAAIGMDYFTELVSISAPEPVAGALGAPFRLDTAVSIGLEFSPALAAASGGFLAAWTQQDPADVAIPRIYARGGL